MRILSTRVKLWGLGSHGVGLQSKAVLISSHGVPKVFNRTFTVPANTYIAFMGPAGQSLQDPGYQTAARMGVMPYEIFGPGTLCPDYSLTKFQGYHSNVSGAIFGILAKPFLGDGVERYADIENFLETNQQLPRQDDAGRDPMDIVTIRYRPGRISTNLSTTVQTLIQNGYRYEWIICSFCRGIFGGHNANTNRLWNVILHE
jgi:hypothetical protein